MSTLCPAFRHAELGDPTHRLGLTTEPSDVDKVRIVLKVLQGVLAFLLEIVALVALAYWGFTVGSSVAWKLALGLGAPALLVGVWATFLAADGTNARVSLPYWLVIALKVGVFAAASVALHAAGAGTPALVFAMLAVVSVVADAVRPLQR